MTFHVVFILAAAAGAVVRYLADFYLPKRGVLLVNIVGSCLAGLITGLVLTARVDDMVAGIFVAVFAGSLTTYSTVALTTALHTAGQKRDKALVIWFQHVGLSTAACVLGLWTSVYV